MMPTKMITSFRNEYRFLSNFYLKEITFDGAVYISVENAYQAAKTLDKQKRKLFVSCSPGYAKRQGQVLLLRNDWDRMKIGIMRFLVTRKFSTNPERKMLLDTGELILVEGNTWRDRFWGQCPIGIGENHLGKILMEVRADLRT